MAIMNCPECNHQVSDHAVSCPSCGFPVRRYAQEQKKLIDKSNSNQSVKSHEKPFFNDGAAILFLILLTVSAYIFFLSPAAGIITTLLSCWLLYSECSKEQNNKASTSESNTKMFSNVRKAEPEEENTNKLNKKEPLYNDGVSNNSTYISNPRHGKVKMAWGIVILLIGIMFAFISPGISILLILIGFIISIMGKAEHWWHWD